MLKVFISICLIFTIGISSLFGAWGDPIDFVDHPHLKHIEWKYLPEMDGYRSLKSHPVIMSGGGFSWQESTRPHKEYHPYKIFKRKRWFSSKVDFGVYGDGLKLLDIYPSDFKYKE